MSHASCLMARASCHMPHASCLIYLSCTIWRVQIRECESVIIIVEVLYLVVLFGQRLHVLCLAFDISHVPFGLEVLALVRGSAEQRRFPTSRALDVLALILDFHFLLDEHILSCLSLGLLLLFLILFLDFIHEFQGTELLCLQILVLFIDDDSHQYLDDQFLYLFAYLADFPVLAGLYVVDPHYLRLLQLFLLIGLYLQHFQFLLDVLLAVLLEGYPDLHLSPGYLVHLLQEFYAIEGLLLACLIGPHWEVHILYCLFDGVWGEPALCGGMHAFLHYDLYYFSQGAGDLCFAFLFADLEFSAFEDDFYDFSFGLVAEELVEVCLLGEGAMRGVLVYLLDLQDFGEVFFYAVAPLEGLVAVAGDFKHLAVDLVADGGHVSHLHVGRWLLQH